MSEGEAITIYKYVANVTSRNHGFGELVDAARAVLEPAVETGFELPLKEQADAWGDKWKESDIVIEGDVAAQQAIRFNIFQLNQTYSGEDDRLNIGPKGFTGEKYGGKDLLGYRGLLPAVLPEHRGRQHFAQPADLSL